MSPGIESNKNRLLTADVPDLLLMENDPMQAMLIALTILKMWQSVSNGESFPAQSLRAALLGDRGLTDLVSYDMLSVTDPDTCVVVTRQGQHAFTLQSLFAYLVSPAAHPSSPGAVQGFYSARTMALMLLLMQDKQTEKIRGLVEAARDLATPKAIREGRKVLAERAATNAARRRFCRNVIYVALTAIPVISLLGFAYFAYFAYSAYVDFNLGQDSQGWAQVAKGWAQVANLSAQGDTHQALALTKVLELEQERLQKYRRPRFLSFALAVISPMIVAGVSECVRRVLLQHEQRAAINTSLFNRLCLKLADVSNINQSGVEPKL